MTSRLVFLFGFFLIAVALISITLLVLSSVFGARLTLTLALLVAAVAGYFTSAYGALIDGDMLRNAVETNQAEALELASLPLVTALIFAGILPMVVIWRIRFRHRNAGAAITQKVVAIGVAVAILLVPLFIQQKEVVSAVRNHRELRHMIAPLNVISAAVTLAKRNWRQPISYRNIGVDATHMKTTSVTAKPMVHVLVVGETARASNFSLAGYGRATNPMLENRNDLFFAVARSCGTATAISLPCMFAVQDQSHFVGEVAQNQDNLLDIAARAGFDVHWFDNGNSCKGVCARVDYSQLTEQDLDKYCTDGKCFDDILVDKLREFLPTVTSDTFLILHGLGSHGPLYYQRYPQRYRVFQPDCRSANFGNCSIQEITNAYDNSIIYTDHVIESAIEVLAEYSDRYDVALVYISDHGESLGEHNLYLHGMPYRLAPDEQTQVPFIVWLGNSLRDEVKNSNQCQLEMNSEIPSHDNLFHTELGLLRIATDVYQQNMDLFSKCRST